MTQFLNGCAREVGITVSISLYVRVGVRVSVIVTVTLYSVVYSIYGRFHIYRPCRHCYGNFSGMPFTDINY